MQGAPRVRRQNIGLRECLTRRRQPRFRRHYDTPVPVVCTDVIQQECFGMMKDQHAA